jgi:acyl-coenzyme A synthetase/AMP-(fatty) acid ligase
VFNGLFVLILKGFEYQDYIKCCAEYKATIMRVVPPTANQLSKDPVAASYDLTSVKTLSCAGAALGVEVMGRLQKMMPEVSIVQGYG